MRSKIFEFLFFPTDHKLASPWMDVGAFLSVSISDTLDFQFVILDVFVKFFVWFHFISGICKTLVSLGPSTLGPKGFHDFMTQENMFPTWKATHIGSVFVPNLGEVDS